MAARHRISTPDRRPTEACRRTTATPGGITPAPVRALLLDVEGGPEDCPGHEAHWRGTASASERTDAPYRQTRATGDVRTAAFARTDDRGSRNLGARRADQDRTELWEKIQKYLKENLGVTVLIGEDGLDLAKLKDGQIALLEKNIRKQNSDEMRAKGAV